MLYFTSCDYFVPANFYVLIYSPFAPSPPFPFPYGNYRFVFCIYNCFYVLILGFVDVMNHINCFADIEPPLYPWYKFHLIEVYNPFKVLLNLVC